MHLVRQDVFLEPAFERHDGVVGNGAGDQRSQIEPLGYENEKAAVAAAGTIADIPSQDIGSNLKA
jgi:hypothetical protein